MSTAASTVRPTTEDDITTEVVRRFEGTEDPRLKQIMQSLVKHIHAFLKDVQLQESEWEKGIEFLTKTGQLCDDRRQEFILLSDTLGVSMLTDLMSNRKPAGATESTVFGPFHRAGAPEKQYGDSIVGADRDGTKTFMYGRVLDLHGKPIAGAELDVWQAAADGLYDIQDESLGEMNMRGKFKTDQDGRYLVVTTRPVPYRIPSDGPVGQMLEATKRHPWRPAHVHFVVSAPGYSPLTTHVFDSIDKYLEEDAVFAVKDSLIAKFTEHKVKNALAEKFGAKPPFCTCEFDFVLAPAQ
ncbi:MAG: intradiol ring-cleavage dioxygenase [Acidobacteriota bacterium]|nr:intradiol ring-cleavage dioxygenase [Acidobacteriota bacterium]